MAHFWNVNDTGSWEATPVGDALSIIAALGLLVDAEHAAVARLQRVLLRRLADPPETWALLCPADCDIRVNGAPIPCGLAVLSDRDELRLPGLGASFFSTETLAVVEPYPPNQTAGHCPRCRQIIEPSSLAVRCPACGLWHHQDAGADLPCWTYAPTCGGCPQETAMDADFRWTPEEL